jgi:threonine synthase
LFWADWADDDSTKKQIKIDFEDKKYLLDTHTAVGRAVYLKYINFTGDTTPTFILSTANPYKFSISIYESLFGRSETGKSEFDLMYEIEKSTSIPIPLPLRSLNDKKILHTGVIEKEFMAKEVLRILNINS